MKLTFLGTAAMVPTKERNVQSIHLEVNGEGILVDCGEGTQRQMNIAGINRLKVKKILISHWHGDHVAGLIGLVQTLGSVDEPGALDLYGPVGSKEYFSHMLKCCAFDLRISINIHEVAATTHKPLTFFENDRYVLQAASLKHGIPCLGYSFIEKDTRTIVLSKAKALNLSEGPELGKLQRGEPIMHMGKTITPQMVSSVKRGKKITFILDTDQCPAIAALAQDADILIAEATYDSELEEKAARYQHLTAQAIAQVAGQANVGKLFLTHFSQRYKSIEKVQEDAQKVFPHTVCAHDFLSVKL